MLLAGLLCASLISPALAQLAPGEATIFRLPFNEDLGMGYAIAGGDFDGDGVPDSALGGPFAADGGQALSGCVVVRYGDGGAHFLLQATSGLEAAEENDRFGSALAAGDLNCDGYDDLAVGIPRESIGAFSQTGAVLVYYGSATGLPQAAGDLLLLADVEASGNQSFARFGTVLAFLDYGTVTQLAIGSPGHEIPSAGSSGAAYVVPHACPGVGFQTEDALPLIQGFGGVSGVADLGDRFGDALAAGDFDGDGRVDLGVGVRGDHWSAASVGAIQVFYGELGGLGVDRDALWYQGSPGVFGSPEEGDGFGSAVAAGDFDGDGYDDVAVGVPGEDIGASADAGGVNVLYGSIAGITGAGAQYFDQDTPGVINSVEFQDGFGHALAAGDFSGNGRADLAIGVPNEDLGAVAYAGFVNVLYGTASGLTGVGSQGISEDSLPAPAAIGELDQFGWALAAIDLDGDGPADLAAATPYEDFNGYDVGLVALVPGRALFTDGFETGDTAAWSLTVP